jgi:hypothetical protein
MMTPNYGKGKRRMAITKTRKKIRDCYECADPYDVKEMYEKEGTLICQHCFADWFLEKGDE